jgi:hypothetical protein
MNSVSSAISHSVHRMALTKNKLGPSCLDHTSDVAPRSSPSPIDDWVGPPNGQPSLDVAAPIRELILNVHT